MARKTPQNPNLQKKKKGKIEIVMKLNPIIFRRHPTINRTLFIIFFLETIGHYQNERYYVHNIFISFSQQIRGY